MQTKPQVAELVPASTQDQLPARRESDSGSLMAMIQSAMQGGRLDISEIRELLAVKKEWEADEARKAFNAAFARFKAEAVQVYKTTVIKDGPLKGKRHANLFDVVVASTVPLAKHGLSTAWKLTKDEPNLMEVTCVLKHSAGHSESVSMAAAPDTGPGRNAIQARGSAKSYLERYTLMAILGLAATEQDDDDGGGAGNAEPSPEEQEAAARAAAVLQEWIDAVNGCDTLETLKARKKEFSDAYGSTAKVPQPLKDAYNARLHALAPPK